MGVGQRRHVPDNTETLFRLPYPVHIERQRSYPHKAPVAVVAFARASGLFRVHAFLQTLDSLRRGVADVKYLAVRRVRGVIVPFDETPRDRFKVGFVSTNEQIISQCQR